ncbi:MAG: hypothetical protein ACOX6N_04485 [Patescibacteria group bacterium]|jgi:hypothetical protein
MKKTKSNYRDSVNKVNTNINSLSSELILGLKTIIGSWLAIQIRNSNKKTVTH